MRDYYCMDVSFPGVDFDKFMPDSEKSKLIHHAHLLTEENQIQVKIFFEPITYFGRKLSIWISEINWKSFGSFISLSNESQNDRLQRIDVKDSRLLEMTNGSRQYEEELEFVAIKIDSIKLYWDPVEGKRDTAEFYLNEAGFEIVKGYYTTLFGCEGKFDISRMNGMDEFYTFKKSEFRPEYNFSFNDKRRNREAKITKEPKIQFRYKEDVTEEEAIKYADIVRLLASFYFHLKIDYVFSKIHLKQNTIIIKKIQEKNILDSSDNLWGFKNYWNFHEFMQSDWKQAALENHKKLSKIVELYNQSHIVDNSSKFLIRFNIIEIIMKGPKSIQEKFTTILSESEIESKYDEALTVLLKTVSADSCEDFKNKWKGIKSKLAFKPMKSEIETFLEEQGLPVSIFPIPFNRLKKIRDSLTHGSINSIKTIELERASVLLYRITGILILNLLEIKDWELITDLN